MSPATSAVRAGLVVAVACAAVLPGCSDDGESGPETTFSLGPAACAVADDPVLMVDEIDAAVAAVEAELGGEQVYFEIDRPRHPMVAASEVRPALLLPARRPTDPGVPTAMRAPRGGADRRPRAVGSP